MSDRYELADFRPETGHLHACERVVPCCCAAQLYRIAYDAETTAEYGSSDGPLTGGSSTESPSPAGANAHTEQRGEPS